eukprot:366314-Chlamydomonas_euryale.AAC.5
MRRESGFGKWLRGLSSVATLGGCCDARLDESYNLKPETLNPYPEKPLALEPGRARPNRVCPGMGRQLRHPGMRRQLRHPLAAQRWLRVCAPKAWGRTVLPQTGQDLNATGSTPVIRTCDPIAIGTVPVIRTCDPNTTGSVPVRRLFTKTAAELASLRMRSLPPLSLPRV